MQEGEPMAARAERVLIVLHDLALGGTERTALRLARAWAEGGRSVTIFCGDPSGPLTDLLDPAVELIPAAPSLPRGPGMRHRLGRALADLLAERRFDVLFTPGNYHWAVLPPLRRLPCERRPIVVAQLSAPVRRHGRGMLAQRLFNARTRARLADAQAVVALAAEPAAHAEAVLRRPVVTTIPLPALEDDASPAPPSPEALVVCAGRLVPEKGFDVALRTFARLSDPEARLAIVGDGPERARLEALAAELGLSGRVEFAGYQPDVGPWLRRARVLLLTSRFEGYAAVIVEALGAGRPVVATDCTPAARELLAHPGAGRVAPIGDAEALAQALAEVLAASPPDPQALAALVEAYRLGPVAERYLALFDSLMEQGDAPTWPPHA
jgi:glycosyltransferase involved in cell wall biosynthesis